MALRVAPVLTAPEGGSDARQSVCGTHSCEAWRRTGERERARTSAGQPRLPGASPRSALERTKASRARPATRQPRGTESSD